MIWDESNCSKPPCLGGEDDNRSYVGRMSIFAAINIIVWFNMSYSNVVVVFLQLPRVLPITANSTNNNTFMVQFMNRN